MPDLSAPDLLDRIELRERGISSVIWCTGYDANWEWLKAGLFDRQGQPQHHHGISTMPGLYFIGFPWLSKRKSGTIFGIAEDAGRIVGHIRLFLDSTGTG